MKFIHGLEDGDEGTLFSILKASGGLFHGNIKIKAPIRPHMGLSESLNMQKEVSEEFTRKYLGGIINYFSSYKNIPLLSVIHEKAYMRHANKEEIYHDIDHFGEQVWMPKDMLLKENQTLEEFEKENDQPRVTLFGEEMVYVGPPRILQGDFSTYIVPHPTKKTFEHIYKEVNSIAPQGDMVGDGGYIVALSKQGATMQMTLAPGKYDPVKKTNICELENKLNYYLEEQSEEFAQHREEIKEWVHRYFPGEIRENFADGEMRTFYDEEF